MMHLNLLHLHHLGIYHSQVLLLHHQLHQLSPSMLH
jgi:hypothetical protein